MLLDCLEIYSMSLGEEEIKILKACKEQYDIIYEKFDLNHYYIRFKTKYDFNKFKNMHLIYHIRTIFLKVMFQSLFKLNVNIMGL